MHGAEQLIVDRVHRWDPRSSDIRGAAELERWWRGNGLPTLCAAASGSSEVDTIRELFWSRFVWTARSICDLRTELRPIVERFEGYRALEPKFDRWCPRFTVVAGGSIGRFEAAPGSDLDLLLLADATKAKRAREILRGLVVWPFKLELRRWPDPPDVDKYSPVIDVPGLVDGSAEKREAEIVRILYATEPLCADDVYHAYRTDLAEAIRSTRREVVVATRLSELDRTLKLAPPGDLEAAHQRWWRHVRLCVHAAVIRHLDPDLWGAPTLVSVDRLLGRDVLPEGASDALIEAARVGAMVARDGWSSSGADRAWIEESTERLRGSVARVSSPSQRA